MLKHNKLSLAVAGALALAGASTANAGIGFKAGEWDIDFSGNVNGFATYNDCASLGPSQRAVSGGLACAEAQGTKNSNTSIESGLLPSALVFSAKSRQMNMDVGVTIGLYPTLRTGGPGPNEANGNNSLGDASINVRQNFLTFGDASWGNIKIGRDIGLFGSDAILSDMTLLGVGSGAAFLGGNTTLGRIGVGYIYTDWIPQITYTSPSFAGFSIAAGMFQTFGTYQNITGFPDLNAAALQASRTPAWQAKLTFEDKFNIVEGDPLGFKAWFGYMYNSPESAGNTGTFAGAFVPAGLSADGNAWEIGARANMWGLELVGYYYSADGIGTTAIGSQSQSYVCPAVTGCPNGVGASLDSRESSGYYGQITYKFQDLKIGYSYGVSNLSFANNEWTFNRGAQAANPDLLARNSSNVVGLYYSLTKSLNLVGEWIRTESKAQNGTSYNDNGFALGAILFF